jgi:hypothetical protein
LSIEEKFFDEEAQRLGEDGKKERDKKNCFKFLNKFYHDNSIISVLKAGLKLDNSVHNVCVFIAIEINLLQLKQ